MTGLFAVYDKREQTFRWHNWNPAEGIHPVVPLRDPHPFQRRVTDRIQSFMARWKDDICAQYSKRDINFAVDKVNDLLPVLDDQRRCFVMWLWPGRDFSGDNPAAHLKPRVELLQRLLRETGILSVSVQHYFPFLARWGACLEARVTVPDHFYGIFDWKEERHRYAYHRPDDPILPLVPSLHPRNLERQAIEAMTKWRKAQRISDVRVINKAISRINNCVLPKMARGTPIEVMRIGPKSYLADPDRVESWVYRLLKASGCFQLGVKTQRLFWGIFKNQVLVAVPKREGDYVCGSKL